MLPHDIADPARSNPAAIAETPTPDRRRIKRLRTLKQGRIIMSDWTVMDCLVRDISDEGARIALGGLVDLPQEFRLLIVSTNMLIPAELEWRRSLLAGLRFTGPASLAPPRMS